MGAERRVKGQVALSRRCSAGRGPRALRAAEASTTYGWQVGMQMRTELSRAKRTSEPRAVAKMRKDVRESSAGSKPPASPSSRLRSTTASSTEASHCGKQTGCRSRCRSHLTRRAGGDRRLSNYGSSASAHSQRAADVRRGDALPASPALIAMAGVEAGSCRVSAYAVPVVAKRLETQSVPPG